MANSKTSSSQPPEVSRREFLQRSATAAAIPAIPSLAVGGRSRIPRRTSSAPQCDYHPFGPDALGRRGGLRSQPDGAYSQPRRHGQEGRALCPKHFQSTRVCSLPRLPVDGAIFLPGTGCGGTASALRRDATTIATVLRQEGYTANYIGKWHLAEHTTGPVPAEDRGGFLDLWQASNVLEFTSHPYEGDLYDGDGKPIHFADTYRIDFMTQLAVNFLNNRGKEPFLLAVSYIEPHYQNDHD